MASKLRHYQLQALESLSDGRKILLMDPGTGKTPTALKWALKASQATHKTKLVVWTTASATHSGQWYAERDIWAPALKDMEVVSWHMAKKWVDKKTDKEMSEYLFIADECMPADTKVITNNGERELAKLNVGDEVLSFNHETKQLEYRKITRTIKKKAPTQMIKLTLIDGTVIMSTSNHPHYTQNGYVEAKDIKVGDMLYETRGICQTTSDKGASEEIREDDIVRDLWKGHTSSNLVPQPKSKAERWEEELLFDRVRQSGNKRKWKETNVRPETKGAAKGESNRENDQTQPIARQEENEKNTRDEEKKRLATNLGGEARTTRRERAVHRTPNKIMEEVKRSEQGLGDGAACVFGKKRTWLSKLLQTRCRKRLSQNRDRVRRGEPQQPKNTSKRQKERREIRGVRVESIEVLKLSDIKRLGLYRDPDYVYCIDVEDNHNFFANGLLTHNCQRAKQGVSSLMGRAFLAITRHTPHWIGLTGTPGDKWIDFYPYFQACGLVKNKTQFKNNYCIEQTYPFPMILRYKNEARLSEMWRDIAVAPDTSEVLAELPPETHQVITLPAPKGYKKVERTSTTSDGTLLESNMELLHYLRQMCDTKQKAEWVSDFFDSAPHEAVVIFYNYTCERETLLALAKKHHRKVWRIDGERHEIPTVDTIGENDVVLCHYLSGSEALNLQFLCYFISYSYNYSYSTTVQAFGRIRRLGQDRPQFYYQLRCDDTVEVDIAKALSRKMDFAEEEWKGGNM